MEFNTYSDSNATWLCLKFICSFFIYFHKQSFLYKFVDIMLADNNLQKIHVLKLIFVTPLISKTLVLFAIAWDLK